MRKYSKIDPLVFGKRTPFPKKILKRFIGAFKAGHHFAAKEFIDETLSYRLLRKIIKSKWQDIESIELLEYIAKFNNEYHKAVIKKGDEDALHSSDDLRRERYNANNQKNRDIMSALRYLVVPLRAQTLPTSDTEQNLVDLIAVSRKLQMN